MTLALQALSFATLLLSASGAQAAETLIPVEYSDALADRPARLIAERGAGLEPTAEGLEDRVVGVQRHSQHHCILERRFPLVELRLFDSQAEGFAELAAGRVDALLADAVTAYQRFLSSDEGRDFAFISDELFDRACVVIGQASADKEDSLLNRLEDALKDLRKDGTLEAIGERHFKHGAPRGRNGGAVG